MSVSRHLPLGTPVPNSPHAVCVSLPTMEDVMGYEEKRPQTLAKIKSGYPRFLVHEFIAQVHNLIKERCGLERSEVMAVCSQKSAKS